MKYVGIIEALMVGGFISSIHIMESNNWKFYLTVILLMHSLKFYLDLNED